MKIKIAYGVDMRLWKHSPIKDKPESQTYQDLLTYIIKTFEFKEITDFLIKFKDDDDELTTISSLQDFQDAYISYKQQEKKSLKLHISDVVKPSIKPIEDEKDEEEKKSVDSDPIKSKQNDDQPPIQSKYAAPNDNNDSDARHPSEEEINAFLSDDFVIDLLSDLFIKVFEALEESSFDVSFIECIQGIILSDDGKYDKLTSNLVWPYFMKEILPKHSPKIEMFVIPMIRNNGNSQMIKQMVPTMLNMMKMHHAKKGNNNNNGGFGPFGGQFPFGRGRRGGRGWRGRGWRHGHHHGHRHHNHHHGRGGFRGYGHGHHGHNGHNPWFQHNNDNHHENEQNQQYEPSAPVMEGQNDENEQMEQEQFEYTEELVAIMNMGFTNMNKIKELLNKHKGNKQRVVQELVSAKN